MWNLGKLLPVGICSLFMLLLCSEYALSEGRIDVSFGQNGVASTDFGIGDDEAFDIVVQSDGRIVVAGYSYNGAVRNFAVSRYLQDGSPDTEFGGNGTATFSLGSGDSTGRAVTVQEDGKIIIAGSTGSTEQDIALVRLMENGYLDDSFGRNGQFVLTDPEGDEIAESVGVGPDGSVVLAGSTQKEGTPVAAVIVKVDSSGELDTSFGESGVATVQRSYNTSSHGLVLLDNGTVFVAGSSSSNGGYGGIVIRFNSDGTVDSSFGRDGEAELAMADRDAELFDLLVLESGDLVATGYMHNGSYREPILARFSATGEIDESFGNKGIVQINLGYDGVAYGVAVKEDGSYLMAGYEVTPAGRDMILIEVDATGSIVASPEEGIEPQTTGTSEAESLAMPDLGSLASAPRYLVTDLGSENDMSRAIAINAEGQVLTAGVTSNGTDTDMAVVRYTAEPLPQAARAFGDSSEGVVTGKYFVLTLPIFNITRNSAASGGRIVARASEQNCEQYCEALCSGSSDTECETTCLDDCIPQGVIERGVVFSVVPFPSYRVTDEDSGTGDDTTSTTDGDTLFPENSFDTTNNYDTVRSGQTSDGAGVGDFGSDITTITPDVLYYVRAFAVLEDETVIYGNQVSFRTNDSCFIATAAYGSILDEHVVILRQFRDQVLQKYMLGRKVIAVYYDCSPKLADLISRSELLRKITRMVLMPIVGLSYVTLHGGPMALFIVLLLLVSFSMLPMLLLKRIRGEKRL